MVVRIHEEQNDALVHTFALKSYGSAALIPLFHTFCLLQIVCVECYLIRRICILFLVRWVLVLLLSGSKRVPCQEMG